MHRLLLVFSVLIAGSSLFAQNVPQYSNFMFNKLAYNPGYAGHDGLLEFTGMYRTQWNGITGNPQLASFTAHTPLPLANSSVGLAVINDQLGEIRSTSIMLGYAYGLQTKAGKFSFGASVGIFQKGINGQNLRSPQGEYDATVEHNDPFIPNQQVSGIAPELNFGVYYTRKALSLGLSATNLLESKLTVTTPVGNSEIQFSRSYVLIAGYRIKLSKKFDLLPNVAFKTDFNQYQTDINAILQYKGNIYGGFSFRGYSNFSSDALVAMLGFRIIKNLQIGYSYDFSLSELNTANTGSHEVFVSYRIRIESKSKVGKIIYNTRDL